MFHAAKRSVHVRVMRLKPVPERPAQHACRRARGTTLHHKVLPVEKIRGISGIKRKGLKPGKGSKRRAGPFPAIPHEVGYAEIAVAVRIRSNWNRIPALEIKIAMPRGRNFRPPR